MTPEEVGALCKTILATWPTMAAKLDHRAFTLAYAAGLMDLDVNAAIKAVHELSRTEVFIPAIATIRAQAVAHAHGERRSGAEAWGDVVREIGRVGHIRRPVFSDPLVATAVRDFGWSALCSAHIADASIRARFIEHYEHLAEREYRAAAVAPGAVSRSLPARSERPAMLGQVIGRLMPAKTEDDDDK